MDELKLQESQKIEELMRNTCVTAPQAKDILISEFLLCVLSYYKFFVFIFLKFLIIKHVQLLKVTHH